MSGWDYCHPEVASVGAPEEQVQGLWDAICRRWPHPCYLGATYLGCGWSWIHECWQSDKPEWLESYDFWPECPELPGLPHGLMYYSKDDGWRCYRCGAQPFWPLHGCAP